VATSETEINVALAEVLDGMRTRWEATGEHVGAMTGSHGHPDVLIIEPGVAPVVVETEVFPANTVELDARGRLGSVTLGVPIMAAIAVRVPARFREVSGAELRNQLRSAKDLEYALLAGDDSKNYERFPSSGWLRGSVNDLAYLIYDAAIPERIIDTAASRLEDGIKSASNLLAQTIEAHPDISGGIASALRQEDGEQTRRMAVTVIANAFVFHESLAGVKGIKSVDDLRNQMGALSKTSVIDEWRKILKINYYPIFEIARQIVTPLPRQDAARILDQLARTGGT
jgi:hypothetical protein